MNQLDPELKRLFKWAREAPPSEPEAAPFGFSGRVLASRKAVHGFTLVEGLQRMAWGLSCMALGLIICGALVFISQRSSPPSTEEFSSALSFLASTLPR
jgi:hypothetical protein